MSELLPTFLIIGAAKAGTTTIHSALGQHPEVFVPSIKEPHFFALEGRTERFRGPGDDYLNQFGVRDLAAYQELFRGSEGMQRGEASPWYLYFDGVAENIRRHVPAAKLIAILRNPVERAYSSYLHVVRDGREPLSFEAGLAAEEERIASGWEPIWHYRSAGRYASSIQKFKNRFDASQLMILLHEDLAKNQDLTVEDIYRFIGVDSAFKPDLSAKLNATGVPKGVIGQMIFRDNPLKRMAKMVIPAAARQKLVSSSARLLDRPEMSPETRQELVDHFKPDVEQLQEILGRDLSSWLKAS